MVDRGELKTSMINVWAFCDELHQKLEMLGDTSPSFKDGYLVAIQNLSSMISELEESLSSEI